MGELGVTRRPQKTFPIDCDALFSRLVHLDQVSDDCFFLYVHLSEGKEVGKYIVFVEILY